MKPTRELALRLFTVILFCILAVAGLGFSIYIFMVATDTYMLVVGCFFLLLSIVAALFNGFAAMYYYRSYFYSRYISQVEEGLKPIGRLPSVAVAVPIYNEDPEEVKRNALGLMKMNYPRSKVKFYFLDDSTNPEIVESLRAFAKRHGIAFLHRDTRQGYKAGALNNMLKVSKEEFIAIFDSDEMLTDRNFLMELLPYFQDGKLSYLQTEKSYHKGTFFSDSVALFDAFFFKFIQPSRALNNTAIFAGSCGIIRRSILDKLGGFPEYVIEDTFFSFDAYKGRYKSLYVPKIYALGRPILTFTSLIKQQWRYNYGDTQFLGYFMRNSKKLESLSALSNMDYRIHGFGLNYLSVMLLLFTLVSVLIVFSSIPILHVTLQQFVTGTSIVGYLEVFGAAAFILSLLVPVMLTKFYFKSISKGFMVFALNFALAIVRAKAAVAAVLKKEPGIHWNRTKTEKSNLAFSLLNTKMEVAFSAFLFILGYVAIVINNLTGGVWLFAYGIMYSLTTVLLYKYG
ncbi:MAG: glycosyltransferase [Candidatus Micrarchaeota archaeon]|nr:glycosyltransferase [Candidatus Micrarchaeota archaeon]